LKRSDKILLVAVTTGFVVTIAATHLGWALFFGAFSCDSCAGREDEAVVLHPIFVLLRNYILLVVVGLAVGLWWIFRPQNSK
jgi:hypothetical protein